MTILKEEMTLTAFLFPKLRTLKTWLDKCLKRPISENPPASNIVNLPKHCWNQHSGTFFIFIDHCQRKLSWKRSLLLTWKILGLLVNTLAGDEMYLVLHRKNLTIAIQMQLSQKQKLFLNFWSILEIYLKFRTFWTKGWPSWVSYYQNYGHRKCG